MQSNKRLDTSLLNESQNQLLRQELSEKGIQQENNETTEGEISISQLKINYIDIIKFHVISTRYSMCLLKLIKSLSQVQVLNPELEDQLLAQANLFGNYVRYIQQENNTEFLKNFDLTCAEVIDNFDKCYSNHLKILGLCRYFRTEDKKSIIVELTLQILRLLEIIRSLSKFKELYTKMLDYYQKPKQQQIMNGGDQQQSYYNKNDFLTLKQIYGLMLILEGDIEGAMLPMQEITSNTLENIFESSITQHNFITISSLNFIAFLSLSLDEVSQAKVMALDFLNCLKYTVTQTKIDFQVLQCNVFLHKVLAKLILCRYFYTKRNQVMLEDLINSVLSELKPHLDEGKEIRQFGFCGNDTINLSDIVQILIKLSFFLLDLDIIEKSIEIISMLIRILVNFKIKVDKNTKYLCMLIEIMITDNYTEKNNLYQIRNILLELGQDVEVNLMKKLLFISFYDQVDRELFKQLYKKSAYSQVDTQISIDTLMQYTVQDKIHTLYQKYQSQQQQQQILLTKNYDMQQNMVNDKKNHRQIFEFLIQRYLHLIRYKVTCSDNILISPLAYAEIASNALSIIFFPSKENELKNTQKILLKVEKLLNLGIQQQQQQQQIPSQQQMKLSQSEQDIAKNQYSSRKSSQFSISQKGDTIKYNSDSDDQESNESFDFEMEYHLGIKLNGVGGQNGVKETGYFPVRDILICLMQCKGNKGLKVTLILIETIIDYLSYFYFKKDIDKALFYAFILSYKAECEIKAKSYQYAIKTISILQLVIGEQNTTINLFKALSYYSLKMYIHSYLILKYLLRINSFDPHINIYQHLCAGVRKKILKKIHQIKKDNTCVNGLSIEFFRKCESCLVTLPEEEEEEEELNERKKQKNSVLFCNICNFGKFCSPECKHKDFIHKFICDSIATFNTLQELSQLNSWADLNKFGEILVLL